MGVATWFDGHTARRQQAALEAGPNGLLVHTDDWVLPRRFHWGEVQLSEPMQHAPLSVSVPGGGTLWVNEASLEMAIRASARQAAPRRAGAWLDAATWIGHWPTVLCCLLLTMALLAWFDRQGAAWAGQALVAQLPRSVDTWVGNQVEPHVTGNWLVASRLAPARQQALRARFLSLAAQASPGLSVDLRFHREKPTDRGSAKQDRGGFNALALPNGVVVVLDGLAEALTDDELLWVLGHEVGHVEHRHRMQSVARSLGLLAVASTVLGDFSSVAAGAVAGTQRLAHSREAEHEADAYATKWASMAGLPPATGVQVWRKFLAEERRLGVSDWPAWANTHPASKERLNNAQRAADQAADQAAQPAASRTPPRTLRPAP